MEQFLKLINQAGLASQVVTDLSLVVDDKHITHGCIFNVKVDRKNFKLFIPSPLHEPLLADGKKPLLKEIIQIKEVMLLK